MSNSLVPLGTLCGLVKASLDAGDRALDKAEQHYKTAGLYLIEARKRLPIESPGKKFTAYIVGECRLQTSRAYELIAIAEGRLTLEQVRESSNKRSKAAQARAKDTFNEKKSEQQQENIEAADFEEPAPRKHANLPPDPRLKLIGVITSKIRDAKLSDLKAIEKFISKQLED